MRSNAYEPAPDLGSGSTSVSLRGPTAGGRLVSESSSCVDVPGWSNLRDHSCSDYAANGWCTAGRQVQQGGSIFGWPERACCVCGRAEWLSSQNRRRAIAVEQVVFVATHAVDASDAVLLRHYSDVLRPLVKVEGWLLLYADEHTGQSVAHHSGREDHGMQVCQWGNADVRRVFPRVADSLQRSAHNGSIELLLRDHLPTYLPLYYFFHTSLLIWNATHGHAYPRLQYFWRLELDVLFAGSNSLADMVMRPLQSAHAAWDVLLPDVMFRNREKSEMGSHARSGDNVYPHWLIAEGNRTKAELSPQESILRGIPQAHQASALVCVGRFSSNFLRIMERKWLAGVIGYEEILLPTSCISARDCEVAPFGLRAKIGVRHIRFRPTFDCNDFLQALRAETGELWHPVKNRSCYTELLEQRRQQGRRALARLNYSASF